MLLQFELLAIGSATAEICDAAIDRALTYASTLVFGCHKGSGAPIAEHGLSYVGGIFSIARA